MPQDICISSMYCLLNRHENLVHLLIYRQKVYAALFERISTTLSRAVADDHPPYDGKLTRGARNYGRYRSLSTFSLVIAIRHDPASATPTSSSQVTRVKHITRISLIHVRPLGTIGQVLHKSGSIRLSAYSFFTCNLRRRCPFPTDIIATSVDHKALTALPLSCVHLPRI
jgi:hypothetical protein